MKDRKEYESLFVNEAFSVAANAVKIWQVERVRNLRLAGMLAKDDDTQRLTEDVERILRDVCVGVGAGISRAKHEERDRRSLPVDNR